MSDCYGSLHPIICPNGLMNASLIIFRPLRKSPRISALRLKLTKRAFSAPQHIDQIYAWKRRLSCQGPRKKPI